MNSGVFKTLELEIILKVLGSYTSTLPASELARELRPSCDLPTVRESLKETSEASRLLADNGHVALGETPDVRPYLEALPIEHQSLDATALVELATLARVTDRAKSTLSTISPDLIRMRALGTELPDLDSLRSEIEKAIDSDTASVKDHASPQLRSLRARIFKLKNRLRSILDSYFRQKDSRKILQDQIITERNGRAVLPVRSECRGQLVGIVHGTSSSGATLFIEPLSTVEINNDIVSLEEQERQEVERILLALTDQARSYAPELTKAAKLLSHLDLVQAKALFSESYRGAEPAVVEEKELRLITARHPLLITKVSERAGLPPPPREAVPVSFRVTRDVNALVFTYRRTPRAPFPCSKRPLPTLAMSSRSARASLRSPHTLQTSWRWNETWPSPRWSCSTKSGPAPIPPREARWEPPW
jgi:DNA mismatch repair protein MutS2